MLKNVAVGGVFWCSLRNSLTAGDVRNLMRRKEETGRLSNLDLPRNCEVHSFFSLPNLQFLYKWRLFAVATPEKRNLKNQTEKSEVKMDKTVSAFRCDDVL